MREKLTVQLSSDDSETAANASPESRAAWLFETARVVADDAGTFGMVAIDDSNMDIVNMRVTYLSATPGALIAIKAMIDAAPNCHAGEIEPQ